MLNVRYTGFGGYMEVPCYEDEKENCILMRITEWAD